MTYELHPLCTLFPRVEGAEFDSLVEDIKENGLRQPIVLHDEMILDGGNRYRACLAAGIEPTFQPFMNGNIVSFVLSANLHRRHLSPGQQAAIVASAQDWAKAHKHGGDRKSDEGATLHLDSAAKRAAQSGASLRTQKTADKIAKAHPELAKKVAHGEISLSAAERILTPAKSEPDPEYEPEEEYTEMDALRDQITDLQFEIARLKLLVPDEADEGNEMLAGIKAEVDMMHKVNKALTLSRDRLQSENAELKKQCAYFRRKLKV